MLLKDKKVAIIGAGPVGLTMARLLQQEGIAVSVYERDKDDRTRIWGGTLDLHQGSGQDALQKAGLLEAYYEKAKAMGRTVADIEGHILFRKDPVPAAQFEQPEINRNDLRQLLLHSLTSDTVAWDRKCTGLEVEQGAWLLHFENGTTATVDLVIGANGGMSGIRRYVTDAAVQYTGTFIIQGEVIQPEVNCTAFHRLCGHNIWMTAGEGINFVANPDNNGALTYNVTFRKPEAWLQENGLNFEHTDRIVTFLSACCAHWDESYRQLFRDTSFFAGLPARKIPLDKPWSTGRPLPVTLIGDAAHVMPPFAGKGVNTGLMDALILSGNLIHGNFGSIAEAIKDYEQKMLVYAKAAQSETSRNEIEMHQPGFSFQKRFSN